MPVTRHAVRVATKPFRRSKSKELIPEEKNMVKVSIPGSVTSPTEKKAPGCIHEILEQMKVSPNNPDAKAGRVAAERWRSTRQIYDEFCSETSFTALNRIHKAKHIYKRVAWLVLCLGMMTWLCIQIYWLFDKYYSYPVEVKIEVKAVPKLEFPSVTICNLNPLKRDHMHEGPFAQLHDYFELDDTDSLYDEYWKEAREHLEEERQPKEEPPEGDQPPAPTELSPELLVSTPPITSVGPTLPPTSATGPALPPTWPPGPTSLPPSAATSSSAAPPGPSSSSTPEASTGVTAPDLSGGGGGGGGNETTDFGDFDEEIDWTSLIETYMKDQEFNRWKALENDSAMAASFYQEMDDSFEAAVAYANVAVQMSPEELEDYGHHKDNMILSCHYKGMACSPTNFTHFTNFKYGNCYTFNAHDSGQPTLYTNYAGPLMGLTLELNIEQSQYIPALSPDAGIRVLIHKRGTYPFPEDEGFSIPPGHMTSVGLEQKNYIRLVPPHADCGYHGVGVENFYIQKYDVEYTKQTCIKSCSQAIIMDKCNCAFSFYYVPPGVEQVCDATGNFSECIENGCDSTLSACNDKCPVPCDETKFSYSLSMSKWPSEQYEGHLDTKLSKATSSFFDQHERDGSDDTLAKLEIYFKELIYEKMEQKAAYESTNLISDIGGQLGLWLGLSAITVGELVEFIASICRASTNKIFNRRNSGGHGPITKVQPMIP